MSSFLSGEIIQKNEFDATLDLTESRLDRKIKKIETDAEYKNMGNGNNNGMGNGSMGNGSMGNGSMGNGHMGSNGMNNNGNMSNNNNSNNSNLSDNKNGPHKDDNKQFNSNNSTMSCENEMRDLGISTQDPGSKGSESSHTTTSQSKQTQPSMSYSEYTDSRNNIDIGDSFTKSNSVIREKGSRRTRVSQCKNLRGFILNFENNWLLRHGVPVKVRVILL